jgi:translation initiation factor 6
LRGRRRRRKRRSNKLTEILLETVLGTSEVGLFALATDRYLIISKHVNPSKRRVFEEALGVRSAATSLSASILISPFAAGNSNGLLLSSLTLDTEIEEVRGQLPDLNIARLDSKYTAVGNLIACNDKGALASSLLGRQALKTVGDVLGVEAVPATIAGRTYVGSLCAATNQGALVFLEARDEDLKLIEDVLRVPAAVGTVDGGVKFPRSGLVANSRGVIVGARTTGPELMTISRIFYGR